ncbi:MAG: WecB/TagA/CpsF family glycosyltransferase [Microthrixaceae bacterium]
MPSSDPIGELADATTSAGDGFARRELFGFDFVDLESIEPIVAMLLDATPGDVHRSPVIVTPNTDVLLQLLKTTDTALVDFARGAWCILPDGQPILWAARILGSPLRARLTGSDLFATVFPTAAARSIPTFVLASSAEIAEGLRTRHPALSVLTAPMLEGDDDLDSMAARCAEAIEARGARLAFLCLGHPKDSKLAMRILGILDEHRVPLPFTLCVGASAEMHLGIRKRAPKWVQRVYAEWFYRFLQEPRRLFHRYFVRDTAFVAVVVREFRARRRAGRIGRSGS